MNSLEANIRDNKTKGQLNAIRNNGGVPGIIYGGKDQNQMISISKKLLKNFMEKGDFFSNIITLNVNGNGFFTTADNTDTLTLECTDTDANNGPVLCLHRNSASPADADLIGIPIQIIVFVGF